MALISYLFKIINITADILQNSKDRIIIHRSHRNTCGYTHPLFKKRIGEKRVISNTHFYF